MTKTEQNMAVYSMKVMNGDVQKKMRCSLQLARQGLEKQAEHLFEETQVELKKLKARHQVLREKENLAGYTMQQQKNAIEHNEILQDTIRRSGLFSSRQCRGVRFHLYN